MPSSEQAKMSPIVCIFIFVCLDFKKCGKCLTPSRQKCLPAKMLQQRTYLYRTRFCNMVLSQIKLNTIWGDRLVFVYAIVFVFVFDELMRI